MHYLQRLTLLLLFASMLHIMLMSPPVALLLLLLLLPPLQEIVCPNQHAAACCTALWMSQVMTGKLSVQVATAGCMLLGRLTCLFAFWYARACPTARTVRSKNSHKAKPASDMIHKR
jgi:hypothetical protein